MCRVLYEGPSSSIHAYTQAWGPMPGPGPIHAYMHPCLVQAQSSGHASLGAHAWSRPNTRYSTLHPMPGPGPILGPRQRSGSTRAAPGCSQRLGLYCGTSPPHRSTAPHALHGGLSAREHDTGRLVVYCGVDRLEYESPPSHGQTARRGAGQVEETWCRAGRGDVVQGR